MFKNEKLVRGLVMRIRQAERITLAGLQYGHIEQEPAFTDRLLGAMSHALDSVRVGGVTWTAKTLTDRGPGSQEREFGADFISVFRATLDDYRVAKGFLVQSKLIEPTTAFPAAEASRLKAQCQRMLEHSAASYVFVYSHQSGILVIPAAEVVAARDCNPHELTNRSLGQFYEEHFECFVGDPSIQSADPAGLQALRERYAAKRLFLLSGQTPRQPSSSVVSR